MRLKIPSVVLTFILFSLSLNLFAEKPPETVTLGGGRMGEVNFPHQRHEARFKDCNLCHDRYPQKQGALAEKKAKGELKPREVMNICIACHKEHLAKKEPAGPIKCQDCHKKKGE